jgi:hypothetical protein
MSYLLCLVDTHDVFDTYLSNHQEYKFTSLVL